MFRIVIAFLFLCASLLTVCPIPSKQLWYLAIAVGEFPWVWILATTALILWIVLSTKHRLPALSLSVIALVFFCIPVIDALAIARELDNRLGKAFGAHYTLIGAHRATPFSITRMISRTEADTISYTVRQYAPGGDEHSMHFYPSQIPGKRPCLIVVHGGSWKSGSNNELSDVNIYFAKAGYQVASINYRLAGVAGFPAPQEDVQLAFRWLKANAAELNVDTDAFVLLGRSAGGQIALNAAYSLREPGLRGVISFYGPTDMVFGYNDPHNQLVMKNREVLINFFGGTPVQVPDQYRNGSPINYVTAYTVPTLLIHGMLDQHVHYIESERLAERLQAARVPHLLLALPWATHGCEYTLNGPSGQLAVYAEERFLAAVTRAAK